MGFTNNDIDENGRLIHTPFEIGSDDTGDMVIDTDGLDSVVVDLTSRVEELEEKIAKFEEAIMGAMQHPMMNQVLRMMGVDPTKGSVTDLLK